MQTAELEKTYDPATVEARIYKFWTDRNLFRAEPDPNREPFTIVIPPPNITGSLHMGHALDNTIQDVLTRYNRMLGKVACWVPGTDHAGIATQTVVEKQLKKEGLTRHDLGRDKFIERVWEWREQYGNTIVEQLKRLGVSCDWSRLAFTMDPVRSRAVRESFIRLYEKGLIYRGKRLINWCPHCLTALSDLEVEHETQQGSLYHLRYPMADGNGEMVIATTRPETILADVAVAVNPNDPRYKDRIGKKCVLPIAGRELPIIADESVLTDFGTGALKITPAHDPTDFEIGERHGLPQLVCIDEHGKLNENGLRYEGQDRFAVRKQIVKDLEAEGFLVEVKAHENNLGHCYRCNTVIEPYLSDQWFVKMKELAEPGIKAIHDGSVRFVPERFTKTYLGWMENIRDWCISRQIWWGHRIPVWTCQDCSHVQAHKDDVTSCPKCQSANYLQDEDVLDTWFSSGLWPFSVFGWPEETADLKYFYPTSVLVTGRDIIFLWVARMIMMGYAYLDQKPFSDVFIHATILTADGQRMSKSKGTGIDPLELIGKFGADATRFALLYQSTTSQDIRHNEERYEMSRNFCNKIWNAVRLCLRLFPAGVQPTDSPQPTSRADRWILERTDRLVERSRQNMDAYALDEVARDCYEFFWNEFCDWYLEMVKPVFYGRQDKAEQERVSQVLIYALDRFFRVAHPLMPFLTEEIWSYLPGQRDPLIRAPYPGAGANEGKATAEMELVMEAVRAIRNMRAEFGVTPKQKVEVQVEAADASLRQLLEDSRELLGALAGAEPLKLADKLEPRPTRALSQRAGEAEFFVPLPEGLDVSAEVKRLEKELAEATQFAERIAKKLENPGFTGKARPEVVAQERARYEEQLARQQRAQERLKIFS